MMSNFRTQIILDYAKWTALSATRSGAPIKSRSDVYPLLDVVTFSEVLSQTIQQGTYSKLMRFLNLLRVDHLVLELARRPEAELSMLQDVSRSIGLGIGVVDIKDNEVETPEQIAKRIERAAGHLGGDRIRYVHPDCGLWMLPRSVADAKMRSLVIGRDLFEGRARE